MAAGRGVEGVHIHEYSADRALPLVIALGGEVFNADDCALWKAVVRDMDSGVCRRFNLAALDWIGAGEEYAPWPGELPRTGRTDGGADKYLAHVHDDLLPGLRERLNCTDEIILTGYSLSGLCALYGAYVQREWSAIGCMSGSLWFSGWESFALGHAPLNLELRVCLSLGKKEARSANPLMKSVAEDTRITFETLTSCLGAGAVEYIDEPGGHFTDIPGRWRRALRWLMK